MELPRLQFTQHLNITRVGSHLVDNNYYFTVDTVNNFDINWTFILYDYHLLIELPEKHFHQNSYIKKKKLSIFRMKFYIFDYVEIFLGKYAKIKTCIKYDKPERQKILNIEIQFQINSSSLILWNVLCFEWKVWEFSNDCFAIHIYF